MRQELGFPKKPREKDPDYLKFIRSLHCSVSWCGVKSEPHHLVSRGAWGSDYTCVPLCRRHHSEVESIGPSEFEARWNLNLWREAHACLLKFIRETKGE